MSKDAYELLEGLVVPAQETIPVWLAQVYEHIGGFPMPVSGDATTRMRGAQ